MRLFRARTAVAPTATVEQDEVDCTWCNVPMTSHLGSGGTIRYFHCPACQRWTTSVYREVLLADTKMRGRERGPGGAPVAADPHGG